MFITPCYITVCARQYDDEYIITRHYVTSALRRALARSQRHAFAAHITHNMIPDAFARARGLRASL